MISLVNILTKTQGNTEYRRRGSGTIRFTAITLMDQDGAETYNFAMGDTIRFRFFYKVFKELEGLVVLVGLRSGLTHEIITSARHVITTQKVAAGTAGTVVVEFPNLQVRTGEYPVYCRISDLGRARANYGVVDGLIPPLIIWEGGESAPVEVDEFRAEGYFPVPSRLVLINGPER